MGEGGASERTCAKEVEARVRGGVMRDEMRLRKRTEELEVNSSAAAGGQTKRVAAKWSTGMGMRLWWWIANAKGGDASGPMSVGAGVAALNPPTRAEATQPRSDDTRQTREARTGSARTH